MDILLAVMAGLVLFLYAISHLSEVIKEASGERAKNAILTFTSGTLKSLLTGIVVTTILDSSSAVIIITIVLVNAGALNLRQAMGIVLRANIGTTISSQIIALDIGKFSPLLLVLDFAMLLIFGSGIMGRTGKIILLFGMLFFGLFTMEEAVEPLKESPEFLTWLKQSENPWRGSMMGALVTLIIQSSSASVGMAIILCKKGILSVTGGIAIMLGAELGTCSDTLLATIKGSRQALKTGLFHVIFNLVSIFLGLLLFDPFCTLVLELSPKAGPEHQLANAHVIFNSLGVILFVWGIPRYEKILNKILPDKPIIYSE